MGGTWEKRNACILIVKHGMSPQGRHRPGWDDIKIHHTEVGCGCETGFNWAGFEVLTAVNTKMAVFWVVVPCSLVEVYQRLRGPCCLHHQDMMMEVPRTSKTLVNFYQNTRRYNQKTAMFGFNWIKLGFSGSLLRTRHWTLVFHESKEFPNHQLLKEPLHYGVGFRTVFFKLRQVKASLPLT
jgi:hypothetical protein